MSASAKASGGVAYLGVRHPSPWTRVVERAAYLGYATPSAKAYPAQRPRPSSYRAAVRLVPLSVR